MYKKSSGSWSKHLDFIISDLLILQVAYVLSYYLRNGSFDFYQMEIYSMIAIVISLMHICVAVVFESYKNVLKRGLMVEFFSTIRHVMIIVAGELFFLFFSKSGSLFSRLSVAYFGIIAISLLYVWHCYWKRVVIKKLQNHKDRNVLLLVADSSRANSILEGTSKHLTLDYRIGGIVLLDSETEIQEIQGIPVVASIDTARIYLERNVIDEVLFARSKDNPLPQDLIKECEIMGLTVHIEIPESEFLTSAATISRVSGIVAYSSCVRWVSSWQLMVKRLMDIVGGIVGLILTGICSLVVIPAIYISDPGPVIFEQKRVGKNGRPFKLYKFRSMYMDAEERKKEYESQNQISGPMFKLEADPRIIGSGKDGRRKGVGWFIRTFSFDEFPQFWNVLKGEMSLVGTRPPTLDEWEQYELHHRARMAIKPGITGMWQVSGRSDIFDFDEVVRLDTKYIRNWSLTLDIKILVKTVLVVLFRKGSR